jgi:7-cyano-7-deazaguanine synthase
MENHSERPETGLLFSGGIDSAVLLDQLLARGSRVVPFYIRTGCTWETCEIDAVERFLQHLARPELSKLVMFEMPLADLYGAHWSISGDDVPDDSTPDEAVYLPGRNPLLMIKPAIWCGVQGIQQLAIATLAANPFRDATPAYFARFEQMLQEALAINVRVLRPFDNVTKAQLLELGRHLPLELTFSCLAPVDGLHCGHCNKCAERKKGFREIGLADSTTYAAPQVLPKAAGAAKNH